LDPADTGDSHGKSKRLEHHSARVINDTRHVYASILVYQEEVENDTAKHMPAELALQGHEDPSCARINLSAPRSAAILSLHTS
jgi:hypothetical protein